MLRAQDVAAARRDGLGSYLVGRILHGQNEFADAARALSRAAALGLPDELLAHENARLLCTAAYQSGDRALAKQAALSLSASAGFELEGQDWLERL